jgi:hypothetical protein
MSNLLKRDELRYSHGVLYIVMSPVILKFLTKKINNSLFLICKEGKIVNDRYPILVNI